MDISFHRITKNAQETQSLGEEFGHSLLGEHTGVAVCLWGELGSGKTTFTQGVARGLGIQNRLLSPTFIIVRRYSIPVSDRLLYHMDLYRLHDRASIASVGYFDIVDAHDAYVLVEWPERLEGALPVPRVDIHFVVLEDGSHEIRGSSYGYNTH